MGTKDEMSTKESFPALRGELELVILSPEGVRERRLPERGELRIGRDAAMSVHIADLSVSRHHLTLRVDETGVVAIDRGGRNGTIVDGARLASGASVRVVAGASVQIGTTTLVVRRIERASGTAAPLVVDPEMVRLYDLVATAAGTPLTVLLLGETGVGKELLAAHVHARSPRAARPMLRLNCAALPASVLESELFGHEKGAFTGAAQMKPGLLETAHESTLFLDEIGDAPVDVQAKLLRFLETGEVLRIGALRPRIHDVRVVAATNRDLAAAIDAGRFRADLFYRLNGLVVRVPPLRERRTEVLPLAEYFLRTAAERMDRPALSISPDAKAALLAHDWPGNVRELRSVLERAAVLARGPAVAPSDLALSPLDRAPSVVAAVAETGRTVLPPPGAAPNEDAERIEIQRALAETAGNQSRAAKLLGISRKMLLNRLERYDVPRPRKR